MIIVLPFLVVVHLTADWMMMLIGLYVHDSWPWSLTNIYHDYLLCQLTTNYLVVNLNWFYSSPLVFIWFADDGYQNHIHFSYWYRVVINCTCFFSFVCWCNYWWCIWQQMNDDADLVMYHDSWSWSLTNIYHDYLLCQLTTNYQVASWDLTNLLVFSFGVLSSSCEAVGFGYVLAFYMFGLFSFPVIKLWLRVYGLWFRYVPF